SLRRLPLRVRPWTLDVVLAARAIARRGPPTSARRSAARTRTAAPPLAHRAKAFAITLAVTPALPRGAETLLWTAAQTARLVLLAQTRLAVGEAAVTLRHDLALVDPDLHADPAERQLRLDEAVVDVGADRVQRHASLRVRLRTRHLRSA